MNAKLVLYLLIILISYRNPKTERDIQRRNDRNDWMQRVLTYEDATFKEGRAEAYFFAMARLSL